MNETMEINKPLNILTEAIGLLRKLVRTICPSPVNVVLTSTNLAVNAFYTGQGNTNLNNTKVSSILLTVLGTNAQISVWLGTQNQGVTCPDLVGLSGLPSYQYHFPETSLQNITIQSTGLNPASFTIRLMNY